MVRDATGVFIGDVCDVWGTSCPFAGVTVMLIGTGEEVGPIEGLGANPAMLRHDESADIWANIVPLLSMVSVDTARPGGG